MMHAPEMSPTLDDAIRALDGASVNGVISARQLAAVRAFLEQLDDVRAVPAVVLDHAQAAHMEGAYRAGVRCADESGHVLVVSLPALLELLAPPAPRRASWPARHPLAALAGGLALGAFLVFQVDRESTAGAVLVLASLAVSLVAAFGRFVAPQTLLNSIKNAR